MNINALIMSLNNWKSIIQFRLPSNFNQTPGKTNLTIEQTSNLSLISAVQRSDKLDGVSYPDDSYVSGESLLYSDWDQSSEISHEQSTYFSNSSQYISSIDDVFEEEKEFQAKSIKSLFESVKSESEAQNIVNRFKRVVEENHTSLTNARNQVRILQRNELISRIGLDQAIAEKENYLKRKSLKRTSTNNDDDIGIPRKLPLTGENQQENI